MPDRCKLGFYLCECADIAKPFRGYHPVPGSANQCFTSGVLVVKFSELSYVIYPPHPGHYFLRYSSSIVEVCCHTHCYVFLQNSVFVFVFFFYLVIKKNENKHSSWQDRQSPPPRPNQYASLRSILICNNLDMFY